MPGRRKIIHKTMLALMEKIQPIKNPVIAQPRAYIQLKTIAAMRHNLNFREKRKIAKGANNKMPKAIHDLR